MRPLFLCALSVITAAGVCQISAQTTPANDADSKRDIAALRDAVIQQTRQIDALTTEIERLGVAMGQRRPVKTAAPEATPTPIPTPVPVGAGGTVAPTTSVAPATATPTVAPVEANTVQHTVAKGENLTIISKKYGVPIDAIQKLNKITDVRKMQVGQILIIPLATPATSPAVPPSTSPTH